MQNTVLIVEDEAKIARFLTLELEHEGYAVTACYDGKSGLDAALAKDFDIIILDIMLPVMNGLEMLRLLREVKDTPVILLTARDQTIDKVHGLDKGADDYMTKPFAIEELLARLRGLIKRAAPLGGKRTVALGKLSIGTSEHSVSYDGQAVTLTKKEYDLLLYLIKHQDTVCSREQILAAVWGYDFYGDTNVVDVYVRYLRSKLDDKYGVKIINTLRGTGYIIYGTEGQADGKK
jgi:DNA-binding response OmpR family regulator